MDRNGNLYFGVLQPSAIACWDSSTPYNLNNIRVIAQNNVTLQFASGVKVITNQRGEEELWVVTDRFQVKLFKHVFKKMFINVIF